MPEADCSQQPSSRWRGRTRRLPCLQVETSFLASWPDKPDCDEEDLEFFDDEFDDAVTLQKESRDDAPPSSSLALSISIGIIAGHEAASTQMSLAQFKAETPVSSRCARHSLKRKRLCREDLMPARSEFDSSCLFCLSIVVSGFRLQELSGLHPPDEGENRCS